VIDIDVNSRQLHSLIFVNGESYAENGVTFAGLGTSDMITWIEQETELKYKKQFQLNKKEEGRFHFMGCIDGVAFSPSGYIDMELDQQGNLTFFSVYGPFPSRGLIREEKFSLSLDRLKYLKREQLGLVEFPLYEQKKLLPVYGVEEIYITNNQLSTIPIESFMDANTYLKIDKMMDWEESLNQRFERKEINLIEEVSTEQAFSAEPSPESFPISEGEKEKCIVEVRDFLRQKYPNDSGKWKLKSLHRDKGYIQVELKVNKPDYRVFHRKIMMMIDAWSLQVVNYMDSKIMLEFFNEFHASEKVTINKEEAYEKLKDYYELKPCYVYDRTQKQYVLCGKLDCDYGVKASNGEVVALREL